MKSLRFETRVEGLPNDKALFIQVLKMRPEIIRLAVMLCVRFPLSLRNVENLLHERGFS